MGKIESLLLQVSIIQKKYDEIAKITGENFNIFSVMRAESDEVRTHSRIIAEFLNPKGMHNQGSVFLKLFFQGIISLKDIEENFDYDNAQVLVEEHIGTINEDYSKGGFIDIVIKDSKSQVVIENKIYATDQKGQLLRYKNNYPNCKLIYLTLEGKEPCQSSYKIENGQALNLENDIMLVSYRHHIKNWIEKCLEKTHSLPIIRETLVQYLHLIKKLTNQTINNKMSEEVIKSITNNAESIKSAELIINNYELALNTLKAKVVNTFVEILIKNGFKKEDIEITRTGNRMDCFFLIIKTFDLKENGSYDLVINVELDNNYYFFCVVKKGENRDASINRKPVFNEIKNYLNTRIDNLTSNNWAIGFSDNFKIGINANEYYLPNVNNEDSFNELVELFISYKNKLNQ